MAKYKVVFDNDEIVVSRDDEGNYRVEFFEDYHWKDEYFYTKVKNREKYEVPAPYSGPIEKYNITELFKVPTSYVPDCCKKCHNHPSNGGSGICNCAMPDYERWKEFCSCKGDKS